MIEAKNLSFSFREKELYDNISFTIEKGASCAFIGSSGSGKSTLVHMMREPENYFAMDGTLDLGDISHIGYVSQFYDRDRGADTTVFQYIASRFLAIQAEIDALCTQMETAEDLDAILESYQEKLDAFSALDGENYESNILKKLSLASMQDKKDLSLNKLSGGEYKLVQVMREMLTAPQFVIMDEPDAFLDFENLKALKNLINNHQGTMLTITHSRYLLNHCFDQILHLENKEIQSFEGNFIDYNFSLLAGKVAQEELAFKDSEELKRSAALVDRLRFIATHFDSAANGRALGARVKIHGRLEARLIKSPFVNIKKPEISLSSVEIPEDAAPLLTVENLSLAYDAPLLQNVSFEIKAGEKVAIIGPNGTGKTTLLRAIKEGTAEGIGRSEEAKFSYLAQNEDDILHPEKSIYDAFFDLGFPSYESIEDYLLPFGFEKSKMKATISSLSGGERNILGLAKLSKVEANFLLLDEPTSHLDTYSQLALEDAIRSYKGAILMVAHDFYTVVNTMDYVLLIEDKTIRKVRMRTFRKMIYAQHFHKDYLALEQEKKQLETKVEGALSKHDFEEAKKLLEALLPVIGQL